MLIQKSGLSEYQSTLPKLSIILPAYNEVKVISQVLQSLYDQIATKIPSEIIVVEDGSTDGTREELARLAKRIPLRVIHNRTRMGYARAATALLKASGAEFIFFTDSDNQYRVKDFWVLWKNRLRYDMVIGWKTKRADPLYRVIIAAGFNALTNLMFDLSLHDKDCGFRLLRKEVVGKVLGDVRYLMDSFWMEFTIRTVKAGFKVAEKPITHSKRESSSTHIYGMIKIPRMMLRQVKGIVPLRTELSRR